MGVMSDNNKLTDVVSSLRGATLICQVLSSLVAFSALSSPNALTGPAQITGLCVYVTVFAGAVFMSAVRWLDVDVPSFLAPVTSLVHFSCASLVNVALLVALFLVAGEREREELRGVRRKIEKEDGSHPLLPIVNAVPGSTLILK